MGADFTPTYESYKDVKPFRFWCQKVLPAIYDDSLSYYELLTKVVAQMNSFVDNLEAVESNTDAVLGAFEELQNYVNNYFATVDVQDEINKKLDEMASDGTFDEMLTELLEPFEEEFGGNIISLSERISILEDRMSEYSSLPDGSTAGDAELLDIRVGANGITYDSAGDAVRGQYSELNGVAEAIRTHSKNLFTGGFEQGGFISTTGQETTNYFDYYIRTPKYTPVAASSPYRISCVSPMNHIRVYFYDSLQSFISIGQSSNGNEGASASRTFAVNTPANAAFIRFDLSGSGGTNKYTPNQVSNVQVEYGTQKTTYVAPYTANDSLARSEVNNIITDLQNRRINLFDYRSAEYGYYYAGNVKTAQPNFCASDFIKIEGGQTYDCIEYDKVGGSAYGAIIEYYDQYKAYIGWSSSNTAHFTFPANARYCRISCHSNRVERIVFIKSITPAPLGYIPYGGIDVGNAIYLGSEKTKNIFGLNYVENGNINNSTGEESSNLADYFIRTHNFISVRGGSDYSIRFLGRTNLIRVFYYDSSKSFISYEQIRWGYEGESSTIRVALITTPANCAFIKFVTYGSQGINTYDASTVYNVEVFDGRPTYDKYLPPISAVDSVARQFNPMYLPYACGNILCIGDSLTAGRYADSSVASLIKQNYPYYLGRMLNCDVENESADGATPLSWINSHGSYDFTPYDTIIIWFGTNGGLSSDDINLNGSNTKAYNSIVSEIISQNPNCKIILVKVFVVGRLSPDVEPYTLAETNTAIELIASTNSISDVIDLSDLAYINHPELHTEGDNNHFTKGGYIYVAHRVVKYMEDNFTTSNVEFGITAQ